MSGSYPIYKLGVGLVIAAWVTGQAGTVFASKVGYILEDLGPVMITPAQTFYFPDIDMDPESPYHPGCVNMSGEVCGTFGEQLAINRPIRTDWGITGASVQKLGDPDNNDFTSCDALAINDAGQFTGYTETRTSGGENQQPHMVFWNGHNLTDLGMLPTGGSLWTGAIGRAISPGGLTAGFGYPGDAINQFDIVAVRGGLTSVSALASNDRHAMVLAINDGGVMGGYAGDHAALWNPAYADLGFDGMVLGMNAAGDATGYYKTSTAPILFLPFVRINGQTQTNLNTKPGWPDDNVVANAVNAHGNIVGFSFGIGDPLYKRGRACLYDGSRWIDLGSLLGNNQQSLAMRIDDNGVVAGLGWMPYDTNHVHAIRWIPELDIDGNGDGTIDRLQDHVMSLRIPSGRTMTLACETTGGLADVEVSRNPDFDKFIALGLFDYQFPVGFVSFRMTGVTPASAARLSVTMHDTLATPPNHYFKFGPTPDNHAAHWYDFLYDGQTGAEFVIENGKTRALLHFVDGARGDDDLAADGKIVDVGGMAYYKPFRNGAGGWDQYW